MKTVLLKVFLLLYLTTGWTQGSGLGDKLNEIAEAYENVYGFSGSILVASNNRVSFEKSYGYANRSFDIKNTRDTRFSINSISKTFTALAILLLAEDNKVELHKPIKEYLPTLEAIWGDSITIHHLLTHTSGLPRESGIQPHQNLNFKEQLDLIEKQSLLFTPGARYEYSNAGITVLGAIIERISDLGYEAFLQQNIIEALNLNNTGYYSGKNVVKRLAVPYRITSNGLEFAQRSKHLGDNAGGGLYSTPSDLFKFIKAVEANRLLSKEYTKLLFQPYVKSGETDFEAYVWSIKYFGEEKIYFAAGSGYGTKSVIIRLPETGGFIGITSNWGNTPILQLLRDLYLSTKGASVDLPYEDELANPELFAEHFGTYFFDKEELTKHLGINKTNIKLHEVEGRLFMDDELLASENKSLKLTYTDELKISFEKGVMIIEINGNRITGKRSRNPEKG
ncbi:serine hydrolase domain-containing protein [Salegentibacter sediminis]|uniref:serine hydrolase domain-containing protein n=1 Tax=Salegentibacter sediminis TaxID=1930251 RepID=UPI0012FF9869|nr:serine hydrolase domain-containing protein [Salegentibacter sediminis]